MSTVLKNKQPQNSGLNLPLWVHKNYGSNSWQSIRTGRGGCWFCFYFPYVFSSKWFKYVYISLWKETACDKRYCASKVYLRFQFMYNKHQWTFTSILLKVLDPFPSDLLTSCPLAWTFSNVALLGCLWVALLPLWTQFWRVNVSLRSFHLCPDGH